MDGFVNVYKERGYSSHNAVAAVRRLLSCKAGHGGTLDPLAEGVLPVGVNSATRLFEYFADYEKRYIGEVTFGTETESYDAGGEVVRTADASFVTREMVEALLPQFVGDIMQRPPLISALKRGGEPLYKLARRGEDVPLPEPRPVHIESVQLLSFEVADGVPRCDACGGMIKPDVVLYEEGLDNDTIGGAVSAISRADVLIIGGTSLVVYPAAGLIDYYRGHKLVLINKSSTARDNVADLVIHEKIGEVFSSL